MSFTTFEIAAIVAASRLRRGTRRFFSRKPGAIAPRRVALRSSFCPQKLLPPANCRIEIKNKTGFSPSARVSTSAIVQRTISVVDRNSRDVYSRVSPRARDFWTLEKRGRIVLFAVDKYFKHCINFAEIKGYDEATQRFNLVASKNRIRMVSESRFLHSMISETRYREQNLRQSDICEISFCERRILVLQREAPRVDTVPSKKGRGVNATKNRMYFKCPIWQP